MRRKPPCAQALSKWPEQDVTRFIERHYPNYWLRTDTKTQAEHAELLRSAEGAARSSRRACKTDAFTAITELTVFAPNHPRLLALFAGACAAAGANIAGAHITTTRDGFALDTFLLNRELQTDEDEIRRAKRIGDTIDRLLLGQRAAVGDAAEEAAQVARRGSIHRRARGHHQQRAVGSADGHRSGGPRPSGAAL